MYRLVFVTRDSLCCDLQGRKITNSKTLVGVRCRDRPWRSCGLPECKEPSKMKRNASNNKKQETQNEKKRKKTGKNEKMNRSNKSFFLKKTKQNKTKQKKSKKGLENITPRDGSKK